MRILGKVTQDNNKRPKVDMGETEDMLGEDMVMEKPKGKPIDIGNLFKSKGIDKSAVGELLNTNKNEVEIQVPNNGSWEYTEIEPMSNTYVPISETYKPSVYQKLEYEPRVYESPKYEPASELLFGEQGKSWENSPVFKETGIGKILQERGDGKSVMDDDKELKEMLFGSSEQSAIENEPTESNVIEGETVNVKLPELIKSVPELPEFIKPQQIYSTPTQQPFPKNTLKKRGRPMGSKNAPLRPPRAYNTSISQSNY